MFAAFYAMCWPVSTVCLVLVVYRSSRCRARVLHRGGIRKRTSDLLGSLQRQNVSTRLQNHQFLSKQHTLAILIDVRVDFAGKRKVDFGVAGGVRGDSHRTNQVQKWSRYFLRLKIAH